MQEGNRFHQRTSSFDLQAVLQDQGKKVLTITLKDYVNRKMYSRSYTDEDIGKHISTKMSLVDVFTAFSHTKTGSDQKKQERLIDYELGAHVIHEGTICYKIKKEGKLTAYFVAIDKRTKRQFIYKSKLALDYQKEITQEEISLEKSSWKMRIQHGLKEQGQNQFFNMEMRMKANMQQMIGKFSLTVKNSLDNQKQQFNMQFKRLEQKLMVFGNQFDNKIQGIDERIVSKIKETLAPQYDSQIEQHQNRKFFKLVDGKIIYNGSHKPRYYVINRVIYAKQIVRFNVQIVKLNSKHFIIGVVDLELSKKYTSSLDIENRNLGMSYWNDGFLWPEQGQIKGQGFRNTEIVEVSVDRAKKMVYYGVKGRARVTQKNSSLGEPERKFVLFVQMYSKDDAAKIEVIID